MPDDRTQLQQATDGGESPWRPLYTVGAVATFVALGLIVVDAVVGAASGADLTALPQTAADRFIELQADPLLGVYDLDLLNALVQLALVPAYAALYAAHRKAAAAPALLGLVVFLVGAAVFVATNTALPMLDLSHKFAAAESEAQKALLAAAGEAMLARGAHGSPGVLLAFLLPNVAGLVMSWAMLAGGVFHRTTGWLGVAGSALMVLYVLLITFVPGIQTMATVFALPGGLLLMAWMALFAVRLFRMGALEGT